MFEYEIVAPYCHVCSLENNDSRIYLMKTILQCNQLIHLAIGPSKKFYNLNKNNTIQNKQGQPTT